MSTPTTPSPEQPTPVTPAAGPATGPTADPAADPATDPATGLVTGVDAYYRALGDGTYGPTVHAQGAWREDEQHMAPVAGLLAHAVERHEPREGMQLARVTYEILGMIPAAPTRVRCSTVRPGRTIELVEAVASVGDRDVVRATAWRLAAQDTAVVAGHPHEPMPDPQDVPAWDGMRVWAGGFVRSVAFRSPGDGVPGDGQAWLRTDLPLVDTEPSSPTVRLLGLVDTANGVAVRERPDEWLFPNVDLTVHLYRAPEGAWLGLDTDVAFGPTGLGLTSSTLHDVHGPFGRAEQILTVRPR